LGHEKKSYLESYPALVNFFVYPRLHQFDQCPMDFYITDEDFVSPLHLKRVQALVQDGPHGDDTFDELLRLNQAFCSEMERHRRAVASIHEEDARLNLELGIDPLDLSDDDLFGSSSSEEELEDQEDPLGIPENENFLEQLNEDSNLLNAESIDLKPEEFVSQSPPSSSISPSFGPSRQESPTNAEVPKKFHSEGQANQRISQDRVNFLRAALQMADEMDGGLHTKMRMRRSDLPSKVDPTDTPPIQEGYLKKQHKKYWKIKTCTLRMGLFEYIDEPSQSTFGGREGKRRQIELHNGLVFCKPYELISKSNKDKDDPDQGRAFEITIEKGPQRVFMAKDAAERDLWVKNIKSAFINPPERKYQEPEIPKEYQDSPHFEAMQLFLELRKQLKSADKLEDYKRTLQGVMSEDKCQLVIPVSWVREEVEQLSAPPRGQPLKQLYKDMNRDRIAVNSVELSSQDHSLEAMVGQLMSALITKATQGGIFGGRRGRLSEACALKAARDVLMAVNRTQSGGDTYLCVSALSHNPDLVVICPTARIVDPMQIQVQGLDDLGCSQIGLQTDSISSGRGHFPGLSSGSDSTNVGDAAAPSSLINKNKDSVVGTIDTPPPRGSVSGAGSNYPHQRAKTETHSSPIKLKGHRRNNSEPVVPSAATITRLARESSADSFRRVPRPLAASDSGLSLTDQTSGTGSGNIFSEQIYPKSFILQINVSAKTSYRIVHLDPKTDADDNLAVVDCEFQQVFKMFRSGNTAYTNTEEPVIQIKFDEPSVLEEDDLGLMECAQQDSIVQNEHNKETEDFPEEIPETAKAN